MNWKFWLGTTTSALFLYLAFHNTDLHRIYHSMQSTSIPLIIIVGFLTVILYLLRALRWFHLLEPIKKIGLGSLFSSTVIGFAANCVLPARLGEFIRANYIGRMGGISKSSSLGTIVVERLFDTFTILLIFAFVMFFIDFPGEWVSAGRALRTGGLLLFVLFLAAIALLIILKQKTAIFLAVFEKALLFLPKKQRHKLITLLYGFSKGLVFVKGPSQFIAVLFYSLTLWGLSVAQIYVLGLSMGLSLPFMAPFFILVLLCFSVVLPSAPGYIGTFHVACQYGLIFYGFSRANALSMAIILHAAGFIPTVLLGLLAFSLHHISLRSLSNGMGNRVTG
jgi:glycosyltransferase 2 family protein